MGKNAKGYFSERMSNATGQCHRIAPDLQHLMRSVTSFQIVPQ